MTKKKIVGFLCGVFIVFLVAFLMVIGSAEERKPMIGVPRYEASTMPPCNGQNLGAMLWRTDKDSLLICNGESWVKFQEGK